jgi:hypothetical protein
MASKYSEQSISQLFGTIAAAQTVVEQAPFSLTSNEKGFTCTFDLLYTLYGLISKKPLDQQIIEYLTENLSEEKASILETIEAVIKIALEANLTNLLTCEMNPIIPDKLIGGGEFLQGTDRQINFNGEGITIPISAIDFTGFLKHCPCDENDIVGKSQYLTCYNYGTETSLTINDTWKHDDFNAFLWYVKNKGAYGNIVERRKLYWDNRYKTKLYGKCERKPESFFTKTKEYDPSISGNGGTYPFDNLYLKKYNESEKTTYKKRQILECRYIQGDGIHSDSFQFRLPASNYYKIRALKNGKTGEDSKYFKINKTIFEFNHDFITSLKLFDVKTFLCQMISNLTGQGNVSFNASLTREEIEIENTIDGLIDKIIRESDWEYTADDCYYSFSNDEYIDMMETSLRKRTLYEENTETYDSLFKEVDSIKITNENVNETKKQINDILQKTTAPVTNKTKTSFGLNYDVQFELLRMFVYPFVRPLFTPKVMTLILINLNVMGDPLKLNENVVTFSDILPYLSNIIKNIIIQIKNIINELLYTWVIDVLTPLLSMFTLKILFEQIEMYRVLLMNMIEACSFGSTVFNETASRIGDVRYADILPQNEELKETAITNKNC